MAKLQCNFPTSLDTLNVDRESGQDKTSDSDDIIETAITEIEKWLGILKTGTGSLVFGTAPSITSPTGIVKGDVGLSSVDNTADTAKPVSTAQQTALDAKLANTVEDTSPELGGEMDCGAHSIGFTQQTVTYNVTTTTVDWKLGNKATVTLTGNVGTLAFTNPTNPCNVLLRIVQDGTGNRLITAYDADIKWVGGTKPTLTTTANGIDIVSAYWDGTNYFGIASLAFAVPA